MYQKRKRARNLLQMYKYPLKVCLFRSTNISLSFVFLSSPLSPSFLIKIKIKTYYKLAPKDSLVNSHFKTLSWRLSSSSFFPFFFLFSFFFLSSIIFLFLPPLFFSFSFLPFFFSLPFPYSLLFYLFSPPFFSFLFSSLVSPFSLPSISFLFSLFFFSLYLSLFFPLLSLS